MLHPKTYTRYPFLLLLVILYSLFLIPKEARAGLILNNPVYIGLESGLVGYWSFDGPDMNATQALDRSGQGNNGTLTNSPRRTSGRIGQALEFDGSATNNDYVTQSPLAGSLTDLGPMSVSAWVKPRSNGSQGGNSCGIIVGTGHAFGTLAGGWGLAFNDCDFGVPNSLRFEFDFDGASDLVIKGAQDTFSLNEWQHILITWDGTTNAQNAHVYKNGVEISYDARQNAAGSKVSDSEKSLRIGINLTNDGDFDGFIDDVRIYNRALSPDEIKRLYRIGATLKINVTLKDTLQNGLVGHWSFDGPDMSGNTALDRSGQGNDGTLTPPAGGGPQRVAGKIGQALEFDGVDDHVEMAAILNNLPSLAVTAWIYPHSQGTSDWGQIVAKISGACDTLPAEGWTLGHYGSFDARGELCFGVDYSGANLEVVSAQNTTVLNEWQQVAVTWTGGSNAAQSVKIYHNGQEVSYGEQTNGTGSRVNDSGNHILIGVNSSGLFYDGIIDDVRIYNRALSADEIKRLYRIGATLKINTTQSTGSLADGLVGHWTFDGPDVVGVSAIDKSGQGNNGTLTNGPTRAFGKLGQALSLDGINDYVSMGDVLTNMSTFSVAAWVKPRSFGTTLWGPILHKGNDVCGSTPVGWSLGFAGVAGNPGEICFLVSYSSDDLLKISNPNTATLDEWQHIVATWNGANSASGAKVYRNGVEVTYRVSQNPTGSRDSDATLTLLLGRDPANDFFADGHVDDVRIYNRALAPDEIKRLYNMGNPR